MGVFFRIKATRQSAYEPTPMPVHEVGQFHVFIRLHFRFRQARRWFNAPLYPELCSNCHAARPVLLGLSASNSRRLFLRGWGMGGKVSAFELNDFAFTADLQRHHAGPWFRATCVPARTPFYIARQDRG